MGSFSLWHWLIVLVMVAVPLVIVGIVWLIVRASRSSTTRQPPQARIPPRSATEVRLAELSELLAAGHITQEEYERQRAAVIASV